MKKIASILMLCLMVGYAYSSAAQEKTLSPQAQELQRLLILLKEKPNDQATQIQYLERFPRNIASFKRLFAPDDFSELYSGSYEYIFPLSDLSNDHPLLVGRILVGLSTEAHWDADALNYLQKVTAAYAVSRTATFVKILMGHSEKEISNLIKYLADKENHIAYKEYPLIITNLRKLGETKLAQQFEEAKKERMTRHDH